MKILRVHLDRPVLGLDVIDESAAEHLEVMGRAVVVVLRDGGGVPAVLIPFERVHFIEMDVPRGNDTQNEHHPRGFPKHKPAGGPVVPAEPDASAAKVPRRKRS